MNIWLLKSAGLAVIPLENFKELLCWEFIGKINQDIYIVYVNAETDVREKVMLLVSTPDGQLTM